MVTTILVAQEAVGANATKSLTLNCQNRKVRKIGIYAYRDGIILIYSPLHEIQSTSAPPSGAHEMNVRTQIEDVFEPGDEPRVDQLKITVKDSSGEADQEVTLKVQVI